MIQKLLFSLILLLPLVGQVPDKIDIDLDGKPFTTFHSGAAEGKPYLAPIRSASGKIVTRRFPMEVIEGVVVTGTVSAICLGTMTVRRKVQTRMPSWLSWM